MKYVHSRPVFEFSRLARGGSHITDLGVITFFERSECISVSILHVDTQDRHVRLDCGRGYLRTEPLAVPLRNFSGLFVQVLEDDRNSDFVR